MTMDFVGRMEARAAQRREEEKQRRAQRVARIASRGRDDLAALANEHGHPDMAAHLEAIGAPDELVEDAREVMRMIDELADGLEDE